MVNHVARAGARLCAVDWTGVESLEFRDSGTAPRDVPQFVSLR